MKIKKVLMIAIPFVIGFFVAISCQPSNNENPEIPEKNIEVQKPTDPVDQPVEGCDCNDESACDGSCAEDCGCEVEEEITCGVGQYKKDGICVDEPNIANCTSVKSGECLACESDYYLDNNSCIKEPEIANCLTVERGKCLTCKEGYYLEGNVCVAEPLIDNCSTVKNGKCLTCVSGYTVSNGGKSCVPVCDTKDDNGKCTSCAPGYYLSNGTCMKAPAGTYSLGGTSISAIKCSSGTYSVAGASSCTRCPAGTYSNSGSSACISCPSGTYSSTGSAACKSASPTCDKVDAKTGKCLTCISGYELNSGMCVEKTE